VRHYDRGLEPDVAADETSTATGERALRWQVLAVVAVLVALVAVTKVTSYDTWVHLSLGRWMSEHGTVVRANLLSHTMPERPVVDHQWLFQCGLYQLWRLVGIPGLVVAKALVVGAAFAVVAATALRKGATPTAAVAVALLAAYAARSRFTLRPQVVSFLLLAVYLHTLERWRQTGRWWRLFVLLPVQVLWANVHGSAVVGVALPFAYGLAEALRAALAATGLKVQPGPRKGAEAVAPLCLSALLFMFSVWTPYGRDVLFEPFLLTRAQVVSGLRPFLLDRSPLPWSELLGGHAFFAVLVLFGLATLVGTLIRKDVTEAGLFAGLLVLAFHSQRFVGLFAIGAAPIVARNVSDAATAWLKRPRTAVRGGRRAVAQRVVVALVVLALMELGWRGLRGEQPTGWQPPRGYLPEQEVAWVQAHAPAGNLFNEWEHGGFIAWRTGRPVFLDSRGLLAYDPELVRAYVASWTSGEILAELTERYELRVALVAREPLVAQFRASGRWTEVHRGPVCSVFVVTGGESGAARRARGAAGATSP